MAAAIATAAPVPAVLRPQPAAAMKNPFRTTIFRSSWKWLLICKVFLGFASQSRAWLLLLPATLSRL
jgi:hypothetical protein